MEDERIGLAVVMSVMAALTLLAGIFAYRERKGDGSTTVSYRYVPSRF
jgi:hypothetical protein